MIRNVFLTLLVIFASVQAFSQSDTLDQRNSDGEKTGWWITYLDENLKVLKDSVGATHCMYNYYTGKFFHYRYGNGLGSRKYPVHFPENDSLKLGSFILLNGDYITKFKSGKVRSILSTSNGLLIEYKEYYEDGQLHEHFIYSTECGTPIRNCLKEYDKNGELTYDGLNWVPKEVENAR